jgi:hypothetical protein
VKLLCSFESPAICGTSRMLTMGAEGGICPSLPYSDQETVSPTQVSGWNPVGSEQGTGKVKEV